MPHPGRRSAIYGEAITADGAGLPVTIDTLSPFDKAGIAPTQLDEAIRGFVGIIDDGTRLLSQSGDTIQRLMTHLERELNVEITKLEAEHANGHDANGGEVTRGMSPRLAESLKMANSVTVILDRVHKMMMNAVRAQDQAVRLRAFVATGDESVTGLEGQSENALRRLINATLQGEMVPVEQRR